VHALGLQSGGYLTLVARPIPENSILEIVRGFSAKPRGRQLVLLGDYDAATDHYHAAVRAAASDEVVFAGAIYDKAVVQALRFHGLAYAHGHTVGGTNPSLVEAMAAANPVIAHDNAYNRWVARDAALYFDGAESFSARLDELLGSANLRQRLKRASAARHASEFTWDHVAGQYEQLLQRFLPAAGPAAATSADALKDRREP
jgi:glycosyltransferase involved in cell wall biosynthesis